jgi:GNAT superfamily N-acetyltransferase
LTIEIAALGSQHRRKEFRSGEPSLDEYIQRYAGQDIKRNFARVFVATESEDPGKILGYYEISAGSVQASQLPAEISSRLPRYPVPVALLGRLAVSEDGQGKGLGRLLLADALQRIVQASESLAVYAVVVDALHERARAFYEHFGFVTLSRQPLRLFLPLQTILRALP